MLTGDNLANDFLLLNHLFTGHTQTQHGQCIGNFCQQIRQ